MLIGGVIFFMSIRSNTGGQSVAQPTIWGTDSQQAMNDVIQSYAGPGSGTQAQISYTQIDPSAYQNKLLAALAAGTGPDIFEIPNRDLAQWQSVATPIPATLAATFNQVTLQSDFPDVVSQDFVYGDSAAGGGNIYALPLSIDTLAMIYNKDLVQYRRHRHGAHHVEGLVADVPALRQVNAQGQITQAALALGGSETSIPNAPDIIFLLMMQNGAQMTSADGTSVTFASGANGGNKTRPASTLSIIICSSPMRRIRTTRGTTAWERRSRALRRERRRSIFDYSSALAAIKAQAPFLNYGVAAMPQPANATVAVNYAKYNGLAVSRNSASIAGAWNFIVNLTTSAADENIYTKDTGAPPALRSVIAADLTNPSSRSSPRRRSPQSRGTSRTVRPSISLMNTAIKRMFERRGRLDHRALNRRRAAMNAIGN